MHRMFTSPAYTELTLAVIEGRIRDVEEAIKDGADVNKYTPYDFPRESIGRFKRVPVITVAVHLGHYAMVTALLVGKPNIEAQGDYHLTPLARAAWNDHSAIVTQLLNYGADINATIDGGTRVIHEAALRGSLSSLQVLHERGARLDDVSSDGRTPLHWAAAGDRSSVVDWLLAQGVDATVTDDPGDTPADIAKRYKYAKLESLLRSHMNKQQHTPRLRSAVLEGKASVADQAIKDGADVDACIPYDFPGLNIGEFKRVPLLTIAAHLGYNDVVAALLAGKSDVEAYGDCRRPPLAMAARMGHSTIVTKLIGNKANIISKDVNGLTAVHCAAMSGDISTLEVLHEHKASLEDVAHNGRTPLHYAAVRGRRSVCDWLISKGVNGDATDKAGETADDLTARYEGRQKVDLRYFLRALLLPVVILIISMCATYLMGNLTVDLLRFYLLLSVFLLVGMLVISQYSPHLMENPTVGGNGTDDQQAHCEIYLFTRGLQGVPDYSRSIDHFARHWVVTFVWDGIFEHSFDASGDINGKLVSKYYEGNPLIIEPNFEWTKDGPYGPANYCSPNDVIDKSIEIPKGNYKKFTNNCHKFAEDLSNKFGVTLPISSSALLTSRF